MYEHAKLRDNGGRTLRKDGSSILVTDGPYSETKEVTAGYFVIEADNYDHAAKLAEDCPHLTYGRVPLREKDVPNERRVMRGNSWDRRPGSMRRSRRTSDVQSNSYADTGFRCVKDVE